MPDGVGQGVLALGAIGGADAASDAAGGLLMLPELLPMPEPVLLLDPGAVPVMPVPVLGAVLGEVLGDEDMVLGAVLLVLPVSGVAGSVRRSQPASAVRPMAAHSAAAAARRDGRDRWGWRDESMAVLRRRVGCEARRSAHRPARALCALASRCGTTLKPGLWPGP